MITTFHRRSPQHFLDPGLLGDQAPAHDQHTGRSAPSANIISDRGEIGGQKVGHDHIELSGDVTDRIGGHVDVDAIGCCVEERNLQSGCVDVDGDHLPGPQLGCGNGQHTGAGADVQYAVTGPDESVQELERKRRGRVGTMAERLAGFDSQQVIAHDDVACPGARPVGVDLLDLDRCRHRGRGIEPVGGDELFEGLGCCGLPDEPRGEHDPGVDDGLGDGGRPVIPEQAGDELGVSVR